MKKIFLLLLAAAGTAGLANAQYLQQQEAGPAAIPMELPGYQPQGIKYKTMSSQTFQARMSQTDAIVEALGSTNFGFVNFVGFYTDSTLTYKLQGNAQSTNFHAYGGMLNPYHVIFNDPLPQNYGYTVDTVWIAGFYNRRQTNTTPDTLRVQLNFGTAAQNGGLGSGQPWVRLVFPSLNNQPALGQLWVPSAQHGFAGGLSAAAVTINLPLTVEDTISNRPNAPYWPVVIPGGLNVPANSFVSVSARFKTSVTTTPGQLQFSDDPADTAQWTVGYFRPIVARETATPPQNVFYIDSSGLSMSTLKDSRYNMNGRFWASPALSTGYLIDFSISADLTGLSVNDLAAKGARIGNAYPNPVNGGNSVFIPLTLKRGSKVSYTVNNYLGQQIAAENMGQLFEGSHKLEINTQAMPAGIYFVNVNIDGASQAVRFVVSK
jgi:hypothetical protein